MTEDEYPTPPDERVDVLEQEVAWLRGQVEAIKAYLQTEPEPEDTDGDA
mgnify:CR=1 FL=1